jgi:putative hydrolase of the HAD superfamily
MKFSAVIFDLFGTLVDDFTASSAGSYEEFSAALGVPHGPFLQHWRQITDRRTMGEFQTVEASIEYVCDLIGAAVTSEQLKRGVEIRLQLTRRALTPRPDALETIVQLKSSGRKIGLLSNCSIEIPLVWPETDFASLFDCTVFSSRERLKKPDPRVYHLACERLGAGPGDCLYVADGENYELKAATEVGIQPVLIRTSSQESRGEVLREAREWQGDVISTLPEVLILAGIKDRERTTSNRS